MAVGGKNDDCGHCSSPIRCHILKATVKAIATRQLYARAGYVTAFVPLLGKAGMAEVDAWWLSDPAMICQMATNSPTRPVQGLSLHQQSVMAPQPQSPLTYRSVLPAELIERSRFYNLR